MFASPSPSAGCTKWGCILVLFLQLGLLLGWRLFGCVTHWDETGVGWRLQKLAAPQWLPGARATGRWWLCTKGVYPTPGNMIVLKSWVALTAMLANSKCAGLSALQRVLHPCSARTQWNVQHSLVGKDACGIRLPLLATWEGAGWVCATAWCGVCCVYWQPTPHGTSGACSARCCRITWADAVWWDRAAALPAGQVPVAYPMLHLRSCGPGAEV
jgi:hypothetical protein